MQSFVSGFLILILLYFFHYHLFSLYPLLPLPTLPTPTITRLLSVSMSSFSSLTSFLLHPSTPLPELSACCPSMSLSLFCLLVQFFHQIPHILRAIHVVAYISTYFFLLLNSKYSIICIQLFTYSLDRHLGRSDLLAIMNKAAVNICGQVLCGHMFSFLSDIIQRWNFWVIWQLYFNLLRNCQTIFHRGCTLYIPTRSESVLTSQNGHYCLLLSVFLMIAILVGS